MLSDRRYEGKESELKANKQSLNDRQMVTYKSHGPGKTKLPRSRQKGMREHTKQ